MSHLDEEDGKGGGTLVAGGLAATSEDNEITKQISTVGLREARLLQ